MEAKSMAALTPDQLVARERESRTQWLVGPAQSFCRPLVIVANTWAKHVEANVCVGVILIGRDIILVDTK